jgi:Rieske Fe-S protein
VYQTGGELRAVSSKCTHSGCTVEWSNQQTPPILACPCHGSVFDPTNGGAVVNGPATEPLPEIPVEVRNGEVFRA